MGDSNRGDCVFMNVLLDLDFRKLDEAWCHMMLEEADRKTSLHSCAVS